MDKWCRVADLIINKMQGNQKVRAFVLVWNNYTDDIWSKMSTISDHKVSAQVKYLVASQEVAPETGTPHIQGFIYFKSPKTTSAAQKWFKLWLGTEKGCALKYAEADAQCNYNYVRKIRDQDQIPNEVWFEYGDMPLGSAAQGDKGLKMYEAFKASCLEGISWPVLIERHQKLYTIAQHWCREVYANTRWELIQKPVWEPYTWQEHLMQELDDVFLTRRIYWIWSEESNTGKSTFFTEWVAYQFKSQYLPVTGFKYADIITAYNDQKVIHLNLPRCDDEGGEKMLKIFYNCLEKLSDLGPQFSGKYQSTAKIVMAHICVTANRRPEPRHLPLRFVEYRLEPEFKRFHRINWMESPEVVDTTNTF